MSHAQVPGKGKLEIISIVVASGSVSGSLVIPPCSVSVNERSKKSRKARSPATGFRGDLSKNATLSPLLHLFSQEN